MAKDPEQRYQRGSEFAEDLRQLQQIVGPVSTTTSIRAVLSTGTRSTSTRLRKKEKTSTGISPEAEVAQAQKLVHVAMQKAPIRDLILGAAILVVLVFVGAQTKLLVTSPKGTVNVPSEAPLPGASPATAVTNPADTGSGREVTSAPVTAGSATPAKAGGASKQNRPANLHSAKQVVVPLSTLDLAVQHQFKDATLFVWVDDKLLLTRSLHGAAQKRMVVFNGLRGTQSETLKIPAGKHVIRIRALSPDETVDLSRTVSAEFIGGADKSLQVTIDKHNTVMHLSWQ
jgi:hypothetical protein